THETYSRQITELGSDGVDSITKSRWLSLDEIEKHGDGYIERLTGETVTVGRVEKMSKSKKNTVDPTGIVDQYGADATRWFMLSDSPPDRDVIWSDERVQGAARFVQRLWRLV
uniref:class I tRNA ligase family protein n=1 Tax=Escherichia coli TaxID=562 RepID=UPI000F9A5C3B